MKGTSRRKVIGTVLILLNLPLAVALVEAVSFHSRNRNNGSIVSSGERREYLLYVPTSYDPTEPTPLVISLHGGAIWPALQRDLSGWNRLADRHGFIVVYPAGLRLQGSGPRGWRVIHLGPGLEKDVHFIADLIDRLEKNYHVDPSRIYANGLSNGGGMTFALSCTLSNRLAAVGMVAAAQFLPWSWCAEQGPSGQRPMGLISFHGTADKIVPYDGGTSWVRSDGAFPDVSEWTEKWAHRNRCSPGSVESIMAANVTRRDYRDCAADATVKLFTLHGGGHTWPGGESMPEWFLGPTNRSVDASSEMWAFFQENSITPDN